MRVRQHPSTFTEKRPCCVQRTAQIVWNVAHITLLVANSFHLVHFVSYSVWKKHNKYAISQKWRANVEGGLSLIVPRKWV